MKEQELSIPFRVYETEDELPEMGKSLLQAAKAVLDQAYAPYSQFQVAAALMLANGEVVCGTNQENAAYPSGICAERTAVFYAGSAFPGVVVEEIFVIAKRSSGSELVPACPCGACRQVMQETEFRQKRPIPLYFRSDHGGFLRLNSVTDSLPFGFNPASLIQKS
jgi:cytidine deaminase